MTELKKTRYTLEKGWRLLFQDLGIPTQDVLRHAQLPLDLFSRKAPTVSADDYLRFWHALAHMTRRTCGDTNAEAKNNTALSKNAAV